MGWGAQGGPWPWTKVREDLWEEVVPMLRPGGEEGSQRGRGRWAGRRLSKAAATWHLQRSGREGEPGALGVAGSARDWG